MAKIIHLFMIAATVRLTNIVKWGLKSLTTYLRARAAGS